MHRSRSREKKPRRAVDLLSPAHSDAEGYVLPKNWIEASRMNLDSDYKCGLPAKANSITFDFKSSSSKRESKTPRRAVLAVEMSIEKQTRRSPPSVVARLMGLDALPSPRPLEQHKEMRKSSQKFSCKEFQGKLSTYDDRVLRQRSDEFQEFKDVFEIMEEPKAEKHRNQDCCHKGMPSLKQRGKDMEFIRQSFIDAKSISTDENLQRSKEFDDALEVLDSNKDLFLKLLEEPHSLFSKHLQGLTHPPSSLYASHASKNSASVSCESSLRSEGGDVKRYTNLQRSDPQLLRRPTANSYNSHPFREHMFSLPKKFSNSTYGGKLEGCPQSSEIVILKPDLDKALEVERTIQTTKSLECAQYGVISHREFPKEEITELYEGERVWKTLCETSENLKNRTKCTTELAKEVTEQMRNSLATGKKISGSKHDDYGKIDSLCTKSSTTKGRNSQSSQRYFDNIYDYVNRFSPLSTCANGSSVHGEQRRLIHHFHEMGYSIRESYTLGEMLAFSETFKASQGVKKACPLGISSKDGWNDGSFRNLPRSKSLPASSPVYENCERNFRNRIGSSKGRFMPMNIHNISNGTFLDEDIIRQTNSSLKKLRDNLSISMLPSVGEGNKLPVREIHVSSEELKRKNNARPSSEKKHMACKLSDFRSSDVVKSFSVPPCESMFATKDKGSKKIDKIARSENDGNNVVCQHSQILSKEASADHVGYELLPSDCIKSAAVSPDSHKEADQPSPVSVLELSYKDDKSTSGCFKKISADLQELRVQLRLLKLESADSFVDDIEAAISSDDDAGVPFPQMSGILEAFRSEEDRDYSYVLDMLIDSGILRSEKRELFGECHSTELPVGLVMFEKLEKKYKSLGTWSSSERKLLFDLVNSTLADFAVISFMNFRPWVKPRICRQRKAPPEGLVEEVWQTVVRRKKECSGYLEERLTGSEWLELGNGAEMIGRDVEIMLYNNLIDDFVDELISM